MIAIERAAGGPVSRETLDRLEQYAQLVSEENQRQNLVSRAGGEDLWQRHIIDGAQLVRLAPGPGRWCDIGSGAGLPGIVVAIITGQPTLLIEPRRLRAEFLKRAVEELELDQADVFLGRAERATGQFDVITARAVARAPALFAMAGQLAHRGTIWLLPKGRTAQSELDEARATWQGDFRLEPSLTNDEAAILVASGVRRKGTR